MKIRADAVERFAPMQRSVLLLSALLFLGCPTMVSASQNHTPDIATPNEAVPDDATAIQIAKLALIPIYGKEEINKEEPFVAQLHEGIWTVHGSLPKESVGGVASVDVAEANGSVTNINHGR